MGNTGNDAEPSFQNGPADRDTGITGEATGFRIAHSRRSGEITERPDKVLKQGFAVR